eukprot:TRINITY_DN20296_c0_g1_i2.p1 TRINITY_DN20296_c0_g1~~TRINITY_DN20296_c0_g1_i2.p1  ORF type:complete len:889 (+),score=193.71 TRINITY_DN20296_c0_g1_i2:399-3065(+)
MRRFRERNSAKKSAKWEHLLKSHHNRLSSRKSCKGLMTRLLLMRAVQGNTTQVQMEESDELPVSWPGWDALRPGNNKVPGRMEGSTEIQDLRLEMEGLKLMLSEREGEVALRLEEVGSLSVEITDLTNQVELCRKQVSETDEKHAILRGALFSQLGGNPADAALVRSLEQHVARHQALNEQNVVYEDTETAIRSLLNAGPNDSILDTLGTLLERTKSLEHACQEAENKEMLESRTRIKIQEQYASLQDTLNHLSQRLFAVEQERDSLTEEVKMQEEVVGSISNTEGCSFNEACAFIRDRFLVYATLDDRYKTLAAEYKGVKDVLHAITQDEHQSETVTTGEMADDLKRVRQEFERREAAEGKARRLQNKLTRANEELQEKKENLESILTSMQEVRPDATAIPDLCAGVQGIIHENISADERLEALHKENLALRKRLDVARKDTREATEATVSSAVVEVKTARKLKDEMSKNTTLLERLCYALNTKSSTSFDACLQQIKHLVHDRKRLQKAQKEASQMTNTLKESMNGLEKERDTALARSSAAKVNMGKLTKQLKEAKLGLQTESEKCAMLRTVVKEREKQLKPTREPPTPPITPCDVPAVPVLESEADVVDAACNTDGEFPDETETRELRAQLLCLRQQEEFREEQLNELGCHSKEVIKVIQELLEEKGQLLVKTEALQARDAMLSEGEPSINALQTEVTVLKVSMGQIAGIAGLPQDAPYTDCIEAVHEMKRLCGEMNTTITEQNIACTELRKSVVDYKNMAIAVSKPRVDPTSSSHDRVEVACSGREKVPANEVATILRSLGIKNLGPLPTAGKEVPILTIETYWKTHFFKQLTTILMHPAAAANNLSQLLAVTAEKTFLKDLFFEWYLCVLPPFVPPTRAEIDCI